MIIKYDLKIIDSCRFIEESLLDLTDKLWEELQACVDYFSFFSPNDSS